jgi:ABC-2 type transport system permease protein
MSQSLPNATNSNATDPNASHGGQTPPTNRLLALLGGIAAIIEGEFRHIRNEPRMLLMLLVLPIIFSGVLALMQGGEEGPLTIAFAGQDSVMLQELRQDLTKHNIQVSLARPESERDVARDFLDLLVTVAPGFEAQLLANQPQRWSLLGTAGSLRGRQAAEGLQAALLRLEARQAAKRAVAPALRAEAERRTRQLLGQTVFDLRLEYIKAQQSAVTVIPTGAAQTTPGMTLMFALLFGGQSGLMLQRERQNGVIGRLYSAPLGNLAVILGKILGTTLMLMLQLALMVVFSSLVLGLHWGDLLALAITGTAFALMASSFGIFCAVFTKSAPQLNAVSVLFVCMTSALGGMWWPIDVVPEWMQSLARVFPTFWGMQGVQGVMLRGYGVAEALPVVLILSGFALFFVLVSNKVLKYE